MTALYIFIVSNYIFEVKYCTVCLMNSYQRLISWIILYTNFRLYRIWWIKGEKQLTSGFSNVRKRGSSRRSFLWVIVDMYNRFGRHIEHNLKYHTIKKYCTSLQNKKIRQSNECMIPEFVLQCPGMLTMFVFVSFSFLLKWEGDF